MTTRPPIPPLSTFIIRFWQEPSATGPCWRGVVQHIQSGEQTAINNSSALLTFIQRWVHMSESNSNNKDSSVEDRSNNN
ncbi:MAG: hypothetical protein GXP38_02845 [Chloroflexi bacterium]|nr:hypothetical protein [Chloroflexota bacterium]